VYNILQQESKKVIMDISIALGGGGSRGFAHVGVLRRLQQEGYHVRAVAGTSAGGIIAAVLAAGYSPDEMEAYFGRIDQSKLFGRSTKEDPSLLGLAGATRVLEDLLGKRTFADLSIPCALTAVDINSASEVILQEGNVLDSVLATIALPGILPPRETMGHQLVDGAVLNPVPVSVARLLAPNLPVVAVILNTPSKTGMIFHPIQLPVPVPTPIVKRLVRTRIAQAFTIFLHSVDIGSRMLAELRLREDNPEVILRPDVGDVGLLDSVNIHQVIWKGEQAVDAMLPELKRATSWTNQFRRTFFPAWRG
jgi:NTE family protein